MKHSRKKTRKYLLATAIGVVATGIATGAYAVSVEQPEPPRYEADMVQAFAASMGVSEEAAVDRLDKESEQQEQLTGLRKEGVQTLGAFIDSDGDMIVNAVDGEAAKEIQDAGLEARIAENGEKELDSIKAKLDARANKEIPEGVSSWSVDVASDTVTVEVNDPSEPGAKSFLAAARKNGDAVRVVTGAERLETQAVVPPGREMGMGRTVCSVGFGAEDKAGKDMLVTAGHCIDKLPSLTYKGKAFAKSVNSRFAVGKRSVDMGIAEVLRGNSIGTEVYTHGKANSIAVKGSDRAAPGSVVCKSGRTTGWTCGTVTSYNVTVTYGDGRLEPQTVVSGLAKSTVCTEQGDSGGAYISGNQAQGMTSGGPSGQRCTGEVNSRGASYFQPLDDALKHYRLKLITK
ncbi:S1 family peptidase [Streptomyces sp. McG3]|uniref:S1 family peptidase n=1 Tax=Streptomyces sp. McG3 TaxID=2725483 RepID=UPI001BEB555D|nr:S1 family peptidase [Streptomyces sp. McG3]MBT2897205.1 S1 family peptidase [Streptomyces sp. McG3]